MPAVTCIVVERYGGLVEVIRLRAETSHDYHLIPDLYGGV